MVLIFVLLALYYDMRYGRIPNRLILIGDFIGVIVQGIYVGWSGVLASLFNCLIIMIVLFILFATKAMGAGDIKLYSLIGIYVGLREGLMIFLTSILTAGLGIIVSTLIHFNSSSVVQSLVTTVSNFVLSGNYKKKETWAEYLEGEMHSVKMTPYIVISTILVLLKK